MALRLIFKDQDSVGTQGHLWFQLARGTTLFVAGWLMYLLYSLHRERWMALANSTDFLYYAIFVILVCRTLGVLFGVEALLIVGSCDDLMICLVPFLVGGALQERTTVSRFLSSRPVHFLGTISYSLYVWHIPVRDYLDHFYKSWFGRDRDLFFFLLTVAVSIGVSVLSHFYFERPARDLIRNILAKKKPVIAL